MAVPLQKHTIKQDENEDNEENKDHKYKENGEKKDEADKNGEIIRVYDIEPNNITSIDLPKRSRYYQAITDVKLLSAGVDYDKLPELIAIWILPYDPFGKNYTENAKGTAKKYIFKNT